MIEKISLYRSFLAVARLGSISAAARSLYVSQPAISTDVISLEQELGVRLFSRTNKGMVLTQEGMVLYEHINNAFSIIDAGEGAISDISGLKRGVLRVGASDMTLKYYLLDYLQKFCSAYPGVHLTITSNPTPKTLAALSSGSIDFGVISEPVDSYTLGVNINIDDIELVPVKKINDIFVCSPLCKFASDKQVSIEELEKYSPVIMLEKQTSTRRYLRTQHGYEAFEADIELSTSDLLLEFAKRDLGIAYVVEDFAAEAICRGELCKIDLQTPPQPRSFILAYMKRLPLTVAAKTIIEMMKC